MMDNNDQILFYDIASAPPRATYAPNPWKTRYALNFKGANYKTEWVELPDVTRTRKDLGAAPCRFWADGEPFYTLPLVKNPANGEVVGDTFDIAIYLDKLYPEGPALIPPRSTAAFRAFNAQVDAVFTYTALLWCHGIPFNPATAEQSKAEFCRRAKVERWDQLELKGEAREKLLQESEAKLGELAKLFSHPQEPFLEGAEASYADIIIGGWLACMNRTLPEGEWEVIASWHEGRWGKLHSALQKLATIK
ncbi:hypothetical protein BX600DRAFT_420429 [Xylariales sp. PMI_506]|nr:hypothetical protein BX600DRAFT_420429 [Xylariales sp. PMI_506]